MTYDRANYRHKWGLERRAAELRSAVGYDQFRALDPMVLVEHVGAQVFTLADLIDGDDMLLQRARRMGVDGCASFHPITGDALIVLNCGKPRRRQTATLMEELAHLLLEHEPCRFEPHPVLKFRQRTYDASQEAEAYDFGAAVLVPKERIQRDIKDECLSCQEIADAHGCSRELVEMRVKRMRLWNRHLQNERAAS